MNIEKEKEKNNLPNDFIVIDKKEDRYNFIFIRDDKISPVQASISDGKIEIDKNNDNKNKNILNKKDKEKIIIDGIIFIYNSQENKIINNRIINIYQIYKKFKNENIIPIIIIGIKSDYEESLKSNKEIEKYNKLKNIKFLEPLADAKDDIIPAIKEIIRIKNINHKYECFKTENKINEKHILNTVNKSKVNLVRCLCCDNIYDMSVDKYSNSVILYCNVCNKEQIFNYTNFEIFKNRKKCNECQKDINISNSAYYCFICKRYFCSECSKNHSQKEEKNNKKYSNIIYPNNLIDVICNNHKKLCYNYCVDCKKNICIDCEIESHIAHQTEIFDDKTIIKLINEQKQNITKEKSRYKIIKQLIEDCLKTLKQYFDNLIINKEKEINIKEEMIREFELFKYDKRLMENIKKLDFGNDVFIIYNTKYSWDIKLNNLFEYFNEPVKLKRTKLCLKENLNGPYDLDKKRTLSFQTGIIDDIEENITDLCPLHNYMGKNYFAISYDNGQLKIYDDDFKNGHPIKKIKEFQKKEGINSLYKSLGTSLFLIGNTKIKKICLSEDLENYNIISEIEVNGQFFKTALELESFNCLLTNNNLNQLIFYDSKNGDKLSEITLNNKQSSLEKEILFLDKISENKIMIKYNTKVNKIMNIDKSSLEESSIENSILFSVYKNINNNSIIINNTFFSSNNNQKDIHWEIFELEMNDKNIKVKKNYLFEYNISYLGKINEQFLLLYNTNSNEIILFDLTSYYNIIELKFKYPKPIIAFELNRRTELLDLLFLCEGKNLIQCTLNLRVGLIYAIGKIRITDEIMNKSANLIDLDSFISIDKNEQERQNNIIKIIKLKKTNFLLITNKYFVYNLKYS